jgi:hypothetical protein
LSSRNFKSADAFPTAPFFLFLRVVKDPHKDPADIKKRIRRKFLPCCPGLGNGVAKVQLAAGLHIERQFQQQNVLHPLPVR